MYYDLIVANNQKKGQMHLSRHFVLQLKYTLKLKSLHLCDLLIKVKITCLEKVFSRVDEDCIKAKLCIKIDN